MGIIVRFDCLENSTCMGGVPTRSYQVGYTRCEGLHVVLLGTVGRIYHRLLHVPSRLRH